MKSHLLVVVAGDYFWGKLGIRFSLEIYQVSIGRFVSKVADVKIGEAEGGWRCQIPRLIVE